MRVPAEQLIEQYKNNLYAAAFHICRSAEDAEDVVQDTFVQYITQTKEFDSEQHIRAWLFRVAINLAKNKCRSFFRRSSVPLEDYIERLAFETPEASDVFAAVMALPEKYRIVTHLFYYEDYSVREIAGILTLSENNVKSRLSRARARLREALKEVWQDDE